MLHWRFIGRQIAASRQQAVIFIACVALSLLTLVSLSGLANSVRHSMLQDARELHAADIIIHSHYPISSGLSLKIDRLKAAKKIASARTYEFYSMVRNEKMAKTLLCQLKVVEPGYPFYGTVELSSGERFSKKLSSGSIIVGQEVLDRLKARIGDTLEIGSASFTIADVVIREPDRPVSFFSFGPRVFIAAADLNRLHLLKQGSRIHFNDLLKVFDHKEIDNIASQLKKAAVEGQERVETFRTAGSGVKRFFENFLFFLNLVGIFTLLLAGIGIQTALTALIRSNYSTIAIMKSVGATSRFITLHFLATIMLLGAVGTIIGLAACFLLQQFLPSIFAGILPTNVTMVISWSEISEGLLLGAMVAGLFSILPLRVVKALRPAGIFRKETSIAVRGFVYYFVIAIIAVFFVLLTIWQLEDIRTGLYFVFGLACLIGFTALCSTIFLTWIRKKNLHRLALRQAARSLHRPGNATLSVVVTLCAALAVIFSISLIERNLFETFVASYPKDSPNVYFIDIQPNQVENFKSLLGQRVQLYPIVRARIASINGKPIDRVRERHKRRDNLAREFNLTYRQNLLEDERMLEGSSLFGNQDKNFRGKDEVPVSILDTFADMAEIGIGDHVELNIQGFPLKARVVSIRTRTESLARPFFYFVFQEKVLKDFPRTFFAALRMDRERLASIQNRVAAKLPNISIIDIGQTIKVLAAIMEKLTGVIQFFTLFSVVAGLLIIISSLLATQFARIREAVYFRILGAQSSFIVSVFSLENILIAMLSAIQATFIAQVGGWIICRQLLNIPYRPFIVLTVLMIFSTTLLVLIVGFCASLPVLRKKPVVFLRDEMEE